MKKVFGIIAIILTMICLTTVFAACGTEKGISFKKAKIEVTREEPVIFGESNVKAVSSLLNMTKDSTANGTLFLAGKVDANGDDVYTLYNLVTGETLVEGTHDIINVQGHLDNVYYTRTSVDPATQVCSTTLYTGKGEAVAYTDASGAERTAYLSSVAEIPAVTILDPTADVIVFADNYYRLEKDGFGLKRIRDAGIFAFTANITDFTDDYYYALDPVAGTAYVYDAKLDFVSGYYTKGNTNACAMWVMESGDILVQVRYLMMDEASEYTYISGGRKYLQKTYIVDAKTGKATEKKVNYRITAFAAVTKDLGYELAGGIKNIATICPIEDELLMNGANDSMRVAMDNRLNSKGRLDQLIEGQLPNDLFGTVYGQVFVNTAEGPILLSDSGKALGNLAVVEAANESYYLANGAIYDHSMTLVYDYAAQGYSFEREMNHAVLLEKNGNLYRYGAGASEPTLIGAKADVFTLGKHAYGVKKTVGEDLLRDYYSENGTLLLGSMNGTLVNDMSNADANVYLYYIVTTDASGALVRTYYRFG